jgi:endonuclease G, mitochondrial
MPSVLGEGFALSVRSFRSATASVIAGGAIFTALLLGAISCKPSSAPTPPTNGPTVKETTVSTPPVSPPGPSGAPGISDSRNANISQMPLGNPDNATDKPTNREHYLMLRPYLALSYNDTWRFPNWVAWRLTAQDIGNAERSNNFQPDMSLPAGFTRVTPSDYRRSGYDRGHNCPSKDRSVSREQNDAVFLMTNITPQQHGMNAGPWEGLESYSRDLAQQGNELYIYCGHGFDGQKKRKTIGENGVLVPDFGWKIVVVVPPGKGLPLSRITETTRIITVRMPNISTISKKDWRDFRTSVAEIEAATGLKFLTALPPKVANALKNRTDFDMSSPTRKPRREREASPIEERTNISVPANPASPSAGDSSGQVWVNTRSGVYWRPGTEFYGKTKQGHYMSEAEAKAANYRPAQGQ